MDQVLDNNAMSSSFNAGTLKLSKRSQSAYPIQHNTSFIEQNFIKKETLHMAFLYSDPLMMKHK
jgi:hypothetical protein